MKALLRRFHRNPERYRIGDFLIRLSRGHALPRYQREFRTYDRFLPYLAARLPLGACVIDVGANVGDTLAAMISANPTLRCVAAEPDDEYRLLLEVNIVEMSRQIPDLQISVLDAFVSDSLEVSGMAGGHGSRHIVLTEAGQTAAQKNVTLDDIAARYFPGEGVALIKSDTDGFDWSVLDSGHRCLCDSAPLLFFECDVGKDPAMETHYANTCRKLVKLGYSVFWVFDNFGALLCRTTDAQVLADLFAYVLRQNNGSIARTFYYVDVLAAKSGQEALAADAVAAFQATITQ